ncbi:MAG: MBL fold metallo-hydrolase, partial [Chitinophagaceae bacterium]
VLSHAHPDHLGGLIAKNGTFAFPNAAVHINKAEYDFWLAARPEDFSKSGIPDQTAFLTGFIAGIKQTLQQVRPKIQFLNLDKPLFDCLKFQEAPGHTPGLTLITVYSGGSDLMYIADLVHSDILLFPHPEWGYGGDRDIDEGIRTRIKVLGQLADGKIRTFGYHLPWPGTGHVRRSGDAFEWVPEVFTGP